MMSDLVTALDLASNSTVQKFFVVTKDDISDLNFIFSEILTFYMKRNYFVVLINFAQSSSHYNHLLLKSGIRLMRDQQNLIIVDGLSEIEKLTDSSCERTQNAMFGTLLSDCCGADCLRELYYSVSKSVELLKQADECRKFVLFIDELNILLNIGLSVSAIETFVQYCQALCSGNTPAPNILLLGSAYEERDPENFKLVNFLLHLANVRIQVEGLKTGYSKDAHGKITINLENKTECTSSHQNMLFKVSEKGAKLLTSGL